MQNLFEIIHEDADLLVINKPAGLVCHPSKHGELSSLIGRVRRYLQGPLPATGAASASLTATAHLVNRLDRETSGVTVVAKNAAAAGALGKIWESRAVEKEYLAIVHGHVREECGVIEAPLGKDERSPVAVKDCVRADGTYAVTEYFVASRFSRTLSDSKHPASFTLLRLLPRTGRKHQIRIHLAHLGHPIVGDKIYGGAEDLYLALVENRLTPGQRKQLVFENQALHAQTLRFEWRGALQVFTCKPESEFAEFIA